MEKSLQDLLPIPDNHLMELCKRINKLSPKEAEVVFAIAIGTPMKKICFYKGSNTKTISAQKRTAYKKMNVKSDVEYIHYLYYLRSLLASSERLFPVQEYHTKQYIPRKNHE